MKEKAVVHWAGEQLTSPTLARRLAWVTGLRLAVLGLLLGALGVLNVRAPLAGVVRWQGALLVLVLAFGITALYAAWLRRGQRLDRLAALQLLVDPLLWTCIVFLAGGTQSGATPLYGIGCVSGALLLGFRGAWLALSLNGAWYSALLLAERGNWWAAGSGVPSGGGLEVVYGVFVNALAMLVVAALAGSLAERLQAAGGALAEAQDRADHAERLAVLGRVAAALAHEIRNPLGAISVSIRMLADNASLSPEDKRLCNIIERETNRLGDLVGDMMHLARRRQAQLTSVNAAQIAREVVALAQGWGRAAGDVTVRYRGAAELRVRADGDQLRQLTWNLVRNAVQAGDHVDVLVEARADGAWLEVSDNGPGIDESAKAQLFDAFYSTRAQGTGLGLAVVKQIADAHRFALCVRSDPGGGACFSVSLGTPLGKDEEPDATDPRDVEALPRRGRQVSKKPTLEPASSMPKYGATESEDC